MFVLGLLMSGPSFDAFASITQDMGFTKGKVVHFMDARGGSTQRAPSRR